MGLLLEAKTTTKGLMTTRRPSRSPPLKIDRIKGSKVRSQRALRTMKLTSARFLESLVFS